jgi:hypothetical protein
VWQRRVPLGVPAALLTGVLLGVVVRVAEPVGARDPAGEPPAVVAEADADGPGDDAPSTTPWSEARKEQPPTHNTARRTAAVRTDARVMPER